MSTTTASAQSTKVTTLAPSVGDLGKVPTIALLDEIDRRAIAGKDKAITRGHMTYYPRFQLVMFRQKVYPVTEREGALICYLADQWPTMVDYPAIQAALWPSERALGNNARMLVTRLVNTVPGLLRFHILGQFKRIGLDGSAYTED